MDPRVHVFRYGASTTDALPRGPPPPIRVVRAGHGTSGGPGHVSFAAEVPRPSGLEQPHTHTSGRLADRLAALQRAPVDPRNLAEKKLEQEPHLQKRVKEKVRSCDSSTHGMPKEILFRIPRFHYRMLSRCY